MIERKQFRPKNRVGNPNFYPGHPKLGGRKPGQQNKMTLLLKDAIMTAAELVGSDGKGKDGAVGYLVTLAKKKPELYVRLLEKVLPMQITGKDGGPIVLAAPTPEMLEGFSPEQLEVLEVAYQCISDPRKQANNSSMSKGGDADAYAKSIGVSPPKLRLVDNTG